MINKIVQSMAEAMAGIRDGSVVLIGGFGSIGQPNTLIDGLIEQGAKDLTVVANNSGVGHLGLAKLLETGHVRKIVCSFPRTADPVVFEKLWREGRIELEVVPQGTHGRAHARRRRRHPGVLHADRGRHQARRRQRGARNPTAANIFSKRRSTAMWRWSRRGRPIAGATSPTSRRRAISIR